MFKEYLFCRKPPVFLHFDLSKAKVICPLSSVTITFCSALLVISEAFILFEFFVFENVDNLLTTPGGHSTNRS